MTKQEIGAILMGLREKAGKSREEVAELLGKSVKTIGHWETGYAQPDANTLFLLCTIYGADLNEAFGFDDTKKFPSKLDGNINLKEDEQRLIDDYRSLNDQGQEYIRQTMYMTKQTYKKMPNISFVEKQA